MRDTAVITLYLQKAMQSVRERGKCFYLSMLLFWTPEQRFDPVWHAVSSKTRDRSEGSSMEIIMSKPPATLLGALSTGPTRRVNPSLFVYRYKALAIGRRPVTLSVLCICVGVCGLQ